MHKISIFGSVLFLSLSLIIGCGKKDKDEMAAEEAPAAESVEMEAEAVAMPGADAAEVWKYFTETSPYEDWDFWPDYEGFQPGKSPHGAILQVFVNELGIQNISDEMKGSMDNGVLIVKENYMPDTTLAALTVMYKVGGFNPENNDWFWAKYGPDGTVDKAGTLAGCIGCHGGKADNDYLFTGDLK